MEHQKVEEREKEQSTTTCTMHRSDKLTLINGQVKKYIRQDQNSTTNIIPHPVSNISAKDEYMQSISAIQDVGLLRDEITKLYEKYRQLATQSKKLEFDLEMEQGHVNILRHDNQSLKKMAVNMTALTEQEEEYISNKLLKHITGLKKEKGELLIQVEQEEEYLTNMLQKKLTQLQKEKIDLENALEQEQEYMVNRLQKQLDSLRQQQNSPSSRVSAIESASSLPASPRIGASPSLVGIRKGSISSITSPTPPHHDSSNTVIPPPGLVEVLKAEVLSLKARAAEMEREYFQKQQQCNKYKAELIQFRKENNLPLDDIDDGRLPRVFRSASSHSDRHQKGTRSASNSSQRSGTGNSIHLDQFEHTYINSSNSSVLPQSIPGSQSPSVSSSSASSSFQRNSLSSRRVSGSLFGLNSTPPQHPPQL